MNSTSSQGWNQPTPPRALYYLMGCLAVISIISALVDGIFIYYFDMNGPQSLLSLSWTGLRQGYLWQPLSSLFVLASGNAGLSLSFFLELLFDLYMIWIMGSTIIDRTGSRQFFRFYFFCAIAVGLLTLACMPIIRQYTSLAGPTAAVIAIITVWTMLHPESELLLFFVLPVKAKWLFFGLFAVFLLINLSRLSFIFAIYDMLAVLIAYLYATIVWGIKSPFSITDTVDNHLIKVGEKLRSIGVSSKDSGSKVPPVDHESKIYDFHSGSPILDDDTFMDKALEKISKSGEQSLTWSERARMKSISEKKSRPKPKDKNND